MRAKAALLFGAMCITYAMTYAQTSWDYPTKPGDEGWTKLTTQTEMIKVCQIPSSVLNSISTKELIGLCINYPMIEDVYAFNNIHKGLLKAIDSFNGLQELYNRKDCIEILLETLKDTDLSSSLPMTENEKVKLGLKLNLIELFLSSDKILNNADRSKLKELSNIVIRNLIYKKNSFQIYGNTGLETSSYLLALCLNIATDRIKESPNLIRFLKDEITFNESFIDELISNYVFMLNI